MSAPAFYVAYLDLDALLATHDTAKPIGLVLIAQVSRGAANVDLEDQVIIVSDVQDGVCRYWCKCLARAQLIGGEPVGSRADYEAKLCGARSSCALVEQLIRTRYALAVEPSVVSMPRDLVLAPGEAACLSAPVR